ncbi:hypothetical protein Q3G72_013939 [Acer saccharum]|nr:hypothetical protein Q3G72_013939 [Acer saccharum]
MLELIEEEEDDDYGILLGIAAVKGEQLAIESRGPCHGGSVSSHAIIDRDKAEVADYVRIDESTAIESLKKFEKAIIAIFGKENLRSPKSDDIT